jgi:hypothetical protein
MPIEFIGMIGVRPEGADGAAVHVIGGEIDPAWVRDFSRAHQRAGFDYHDLGVTTLLIRGFLPLRDAPARKIHERASRSRPGAAGGRSHGAGEVGPPSPARSAQRCDPAASRFVVQEFSGLEYGRELIPLIRREVARRDRAAA